MKKTYGLSDTNAGDGGDSGGLGIDELREKARNLQASEAFRDGMNKNHAATVTQVNEMYKTIGALTATKGKK